MNTQILNKPLYSVSEAAQLIGIGKTRFYQELAEGKIAATKVGPQNTCFSRGDSKLYRQPSGSLREVISMSVQTKNNDISPWQKSDNEWFDANKDRSYRIRKAISDEPMLSKYDGIPPEHCWVMVRKIMRRVYSGTLIISKYPPPDDEAYLLALYEVKKRVQAASGLSGRIFIISEE
jgi:excisionase family DNA binding protein